jgi:hypothetical protein
MLTTTTAQKMIITIATPDRTGMFATIEHQPEGLIDWNKYELGSAGFHAGVNANLLSQIIRLVHRKQDNPTELWEAIKHFTRIYSGEKSNEGENTNAEGHPVKWLEMPTRHEGKACCILCGDTMIWSLETPDFDTTSKHRNAA